MACIKNAFEEFSNEWRYHSLSSEMNKSPYQLWNYSMTRLFHLDATSAKIVEITDWSELGIGDEACKNSKNSKSK